MRAWTPVARSAPLWSQMGMPSHVPIAFRCFKTASPQRLAQNRHLGHSHNPWRVRALAVLNSGHAGQILLHQRAGSWPGISRERCSTRVPQSPAHGRTWRAAPCFFLARSRPSGAPAACWHGGGQGRPRCLLASHHEAAQGLECELGRYRPCCPCSSLPEALSGRLRRAVSTREGRPVQGR